MPPILLFITQALIIVTGAIALAIWLHRRLPAMWRSWVWGAIAFVASQVVRLPLLFALTIFFQQTQLIPRDADPNFVFWFNTLVLAGTAALFEETSRYIVLRWLAKDVRGWKEAVMFGAGYGGIEAILIVGGAAITNAYLLLAADSLIAQSRAVAPAQVDQLIAQIDALRNVQAWEIGLSIYERALAIALQIALSILVMRAVMEKRLIWLFAAMSIHFAANTIALVVLRVGGVVASEVTLTVVVAVLAVFIIARAPRTPSLQINAA
jgi:uncharacterized membrane protein YhfC